MKLVASLRRGRSAGIQKESICVLLLLSGDAGACCIVEGDISMEDGSASSIGRGIRNPREPLPVKAKYTKEASTAPSDLR
jgi:hypothetical protein